ncbi:MAG: TIGR02391 family protein [Paracoccaceae bacterium]|nr:TIGR02391 family protein [Paracoccaceae bacterium]
MKTTFTLNWDSIKATPGQQDYEPDFITEQCNQSEQGTIILLKNIKRNTPYNKEDLAISLSKLFNCFDETFKCFVSLNGDAPYKIDSQLRYKSIEKQEFIWQFPEFSNNLEDGYKNSCLITGKIISTEKPLRPGLRGITLFANGRLVNQPEFFGVSESNIGFSYLTGWLNVDFVDDYENDVIATNRQSLNWDETGMPELRAFLQKSVRKIERDRREKRNKKRRETIKEKSEINIDEWYNKLPDNVLTSVVPIVNEIVDDSEISNEKQAKLVKNLYSLVPEYPYYHWRHIHTEVQDASKFAYQNNDYYTAFTEAVKRYVNKVKSNTKNLREDDDPLMGMVFGVEKGKPKLLSVTQKYKRPDGSNFNNKTLENIENGQRVLSQGVIKGCRNPIAHEEHNDLRESGLFSEKDCLDALSILSHLFRRLEDAIEIRDKEK